MGNDDVIPNALHPLTYDDVLALKGAYPEMQLSLQDDAIFCKGILSINHTYNGYQIQDSFEISIKLPSQYPTHLPVTTETGGRTDDIAKRRAVSLLDVHVFPMYKNACVGGLGSIRDKFPKGALFHTYITELVIPYFYGLSFFEKEGYWPWGERSHGSLGLLEDYADTDHNIHIDELTSILRVLRINPDWKTVGKYLRKIKTHRQCLCGSGKDFAVCHSLGWEGLLKMQKSISAYKLDPHQC